MFRCLQKSSTGSYKSPRIIHTKAVEWFVVQMGQHSGNKRCGLNAQIAWELLHKAVTTTGQTVIVGMVQYFQPTLPTITPEAPGSSEFERHELIITILHLVGAPVCQLSITTTATNPKMKHIRVEEEQSTYICIETQTAWQSCGFCGVVVCAVVVLRANFVMSAS